jgi:hypothetical protein
MPSKRECRTVAPLLWDHAAGLLAGGDLERTEAHLRDCAMCRDEVARYGVVVRMVGEDAMRPMPAYETTWPDVQRRLSPSGMPRRRARPWVVALPMAVLALCVIAVERVHDASRPPKSGGPVAHFVRPEGHNAGSATAEPVLGPTGTRRQGVAHAPSAPRCRARRPAIARLPGIEGDRGIAQGEAYPVVDLQDLEGVGQSPEMKATVAQMKPEAPGSARVAAWQRTPSGAASKIEWTLAGSRDAGGSFEEMRVSVGRSLRPMLTVAWAWPDDTSEEQKGEQP